MGSIALLLILVGAFIAYEAAKNFQPANAEASASPAAPITPTAASNLTAIPNAGQGAVGSNIGWILTNAQQAAGVNGWDAGLRAVLAQENGGLNSAAVNPVSVNGEHATGLFQMLPSTFAANASPSCTDILNPMCNAIAAINYIRQRYGSPANIPNLGTSAYQGY